MGAVATTPIKVVFTGDASLRRRPMPRVLDPLTLFGAEYSGARGRPHADHAARRGASRIAVDYEVTVASAQVKSAMLLAALNAPGRSRIVQRALTRDHTERMLQGVRRGDRGRVPCRMAAKRLRVMGEAELKPARRCSARSVLGRVSAGRRADRSGLARFPFRRSAQSAPHRLDRNAAGDGRGHQNRKSRARAAARRSAISSCARLRSRASTCRPPARRR